MSKISDLTAATALAASDLFPLNQSGATKKSTVNNAAEAFAVDPSSLWTFRASSAANSSNATSVTIDKPTGTTAGDLMIFAATTRNTTVGDPSGGAAVTEVYDLDTDTNERAGLWWKIDGGAEPATYTLATSTGATARIAVVCLVFTGLTDIVAWRSRHGANDCEVWTPSCGSTPGGLSLHLFHNSYTDPGSATWVSPGLTAVSSNAGSDTSIYAAYRKSRGYHSGGASLVGMTVSTGDYVQASVATFD